MTTAPTPRIRQLSATGFVLLRELEGFRGELYADQAGKATIGYGHLIQEGEQFPEKISQKEAEDLLLRDVARFEQAVSGEVQGLGLRQSQYDALVIFAFNVGVANFRSSTLLRRVKARKFFGAADEFPRWNKIRVNGRLVESKGLSNRRKRERDLWLAD